MADHTIHIAAANDSLGDPCLQIFDDDNEGDPINSKTGHEKGLGVRKHLSFKTQHNVHWKAEDPNGTLQITWAGGSIAFPLSGQGSREVIATLPPVLPTAALNRLKYTITLTLPITPTPAIGPTTFTISEDPQVIFDNDTGLLGGKARKQRAVKAKAKH
jgi:hypothetical protein